MTVVAPTPAADTDVPTADGARSATTADLAAGSSVDIVAAWRDAGIAALLDELDRELVGLAPVKARLREIAALLLVAQLRARAGLTTERPTLHMSFTGRPGTGKTTVAGRVAALLHALGFVQRGQLEVATRDDLVGQYVGHTAPKAREMLRRAEGGVLFVDEAYTLYRPESERDYGLEAIEMLMHAMETRRDAVVVIVAGYKERMDDFFQANPGLHSRIAHHIDFPDFTPDELMAIAEHMVRQQQYALDQASRLALREYLQHRAAQPHFSNARSVRNAIDRAKLRQASRLLRQGGRVPATELARIDAADIRVSRVFAAVEPEPAADPQP